MSQLLQRTLLLRLHGRRRQSCSVSRYRILAFSSVAQDTTLHTSHQTAAKACVQVLRSKQSLLVLAESPWTRHFPAPSVIVDDSRMVADVRPPKATTPVRRKAGPRAHGHAKKVVFKPLHRRGAAVACRPSNLHTVLNNNRSVMMKRVASALVVDLLHNTERNTNGIIGMFGKPMGTAVVARLAPSSSVLPAISASPTRNSETLTDEISSASHEKLAPDAVTTVKDEPITFAEGSIKNTEPAKIDDPLPHLESPTTPESLVPPSDVVSTETGQNSSVRLTRNIDGPTSSPLPVTETLQPQQPNKFHRPVGELYYLLHNKKRQKAMNLYREMRDHNVPLHGHTVKALFRLYAPRYPFQMYELLRDYQKYEDTVEYMHGDGDSSGYVNFYERLCTSLRYLDSTNSERGKARDLADSLARDIRRLDRNGKERCYPSFVASMVEQRWVTVGSMAREFYDEIIREKFEVPDGWFNHLLSCSRFNRQGDVDFADVMQRAVDSTVQPNSIVLLQALENLYPFHDTEGMEMFLESILRLRENSESGERYVVDVHTLELIGAAAARQGNSEVNLLIWDVIDGQNTPPTEAIYENTTSAFATSPFTYREAFTVLYEMEASGYKPSRALIRTLSTCFRLSGRDLSFATEQIRQLALDGTKVTLSALNSVISAAAERGEVIRVIDLYSLFEQHQIEPDANTFSFIFEAMGKRTRWKLKSTGEMNPKQLETFIVTADSFVQRMEEAGIQPTHHVIRDYVEFLCHVEQIDTANSVVFGVADDLSLLSSKTIYRVAMSNAKAQQFDIAREVVKLEQRAHMWWLIQTIDTMEDAAFQNDQEGSFESTRDAAFDSTSETMVESTDEEPS